MRGERVERGKGVSGKEVKHKRGDERGVRKRIRGIRRE